MGKKQEASGSMGGNGGFFLSEPYSGGVCLKEEDSGVRITCVKGVNVRRSCV